MFQANLNRAKAPPSKLFQKAADGPHDQASFQKLAQRLNMLTDNENSIAENQASIFPSADPIPGHKLPLPASQEEHILRCLGAAVILQWNSLPRKLRRELFDKAGSIADLLEPVLKGQIARYLHVHKNDAEAGVGGPLEGVVSLAAIERWDNEGGASSRAAGPEIEHARAGTGEEAWRWRSAD
jgi:hypothetical protein